MESIADRNTSFNVAEAEIARRLMPDRDAWAFVGPYVLTNSDQDAAGYRAGFRGYAYPDLLLQIAVTDDDIFKTNAAFSVTWFVGRTRTNFQPACGLPDRMREPVMRNDYVALQADAGSWAAKRSRTPTASAFRFVHVNSECAQRRRWHVRESAQRRGQRRRRTARKTTSSCCSRTACSTIRTTLVLQDNQRLLGEGNGEFFTIKTQQRAWS